MSDHLQPSCACVSRRSFMRAAAGCGAYALWALSGLPGAARKAFAAETKGEVVATEKFARLERLSEGLWAVISTPTGGFTTVSNGGLVSGNYFALAIEGFMSPAGGTWLADHCEALTRQRPTHVVLTHFHGDHINGLRGYLTSNPKPMIIVTETVRDRLPEEVKAENAFMVLDPEKPSELDLGGKTARFTPRLGHTPSDVTITVVERNTTWCGDLYWNGMFPNYVDAVPSKLAPNCREMLSDKSATYVPGHGAIGDAKALENYLALLDDIAEAARSAFKRGVPAEEAWQEYKAPESLGEWTLFRPDFPKAAFVAWEHELKSKA